MRSVWGTLYISHIILSLLETLGLLVVPLLFFFCFSFIYSFKGYHIVTSFSCCQAIEVSPQDNILWPPN